jgi:hypothetical protein
MAVTDVEFLRRCGEDQRLLPSGNQFATSVTGTEGAARLNDSYIRRDLLTAQRQGLRPPSGQPIKYIPKQAGHPRRAQRIRRQLRQTFSGLLRRQHGSGCADLITGTDRRTMILGGTDEPTVWPPVAYHDPHVDRPNSPPVSRAYCSMWCGICLRLPARKAAAS